MNQIFSGGQFISCISFAESAKRPITQRLVFITTEFSRAREQLKAGLVMGMESTSSRVGHMGRNELLKGRVLTEDERKKTMKNLIT